MILVPVAGYQNFRLEGTDRLKLEMSWSEPPPWYHSSIAAEMLWSFSTEDDQDTTENRHSILAHI